MKSSLAALRLVVVILSVTRSFAAPPDSSFSYQGRLNDGSGPATGTYDLRFQLFDADAFGNSVAGPITNFSVAISSGIFAATLDFGSTVFPGDPRWLEIGVRTNGLEAFVTLNPRQRIMAVPYALRAATVSNLDGVNSLGTIDNQALEFKVNNSRALRIEPTESSPNLIGGWEGNSVSAGSSGAVIGGGGTATQLDTPFANAGPVGGTSNTIENANFGTIAGGVGNRLGFLLIGAYADYSVIGGGFGNYASSSGGTVGGGGGNSVDNADYGTIAGGAENSVGFRGAGTFAPYSAIGGGTQNLIRGSLGGTIAGGTGNHILGSVPLLSTSATISGGAANQISGSQGATIAGGEGNLISELCGWAAIGGGQGNRNDGTLGTIAGGGGNRIFSFCDDGLPNRYSSIGGGLNNSIAILSDHSTISGGANNYIDGTSATIGGGAGNSVTASYATIPGGVGAAAGNPGQMAYAGGQFAVAGDAQTSVFVCRGTTTNETLTELFLDGVSQRIQIQNNATWGFSVIVTGRAANGDSASYEIRGTIKNNNGTTSLVRGTRFDRLGNDDPSWLALVAANNASDSLTVRVRGAANTSIRWVATIRTTEVIF